MKYSLSWLNQVLEKGIHHEFFFFWGHTQKNEGLTDKSCFSQWFPSPFTVDGVIYLTAEHWMMAKKAELFNDIEIKQHILKSETPGIAKELGRKVKNFDDEKWSKACFEIVVEGNVNKFLKQDELRKFLLNTGDKVIVEASPGDTIWGIGLSQDNPKAMSPSTWRGKNLLGFALMEVRDRLKDNIKTNGHDR
jgi:ribA/ribD-fused uncharacterized protein